MNGAKSRNKAFSDSFRHRGTEIGDHIMCDKVFGLDWSAGYIEINNGNVS